VRRYLDMFPAARYFIVGFGTNDLGMGYDVETTSREIIEHLAEMVAAIRAASRRPILFNVPHVKESAFSQSLATAAHADRDYHNGQLTAYCLAESIPLADVCSALGDDHFGDPVHPNEQGARQIAEAVFDVLCTAIADET